MTKDDWLRFVVWSSFWGFVILSWAAVAFYAFIAGGAPCEELGTCTFESVVTVVLWVLLPAQVLIFVLIKDKLSKAS